MSRLIGLLEDRLGRKAIVRLAPRPATDVGETHADLARIAQAVGFAPRTSLDVGIGRFASWFMEYRSTTEKPVDAAASPA